MKKILFLILTLLLLAGAFVAYIFYQRVFAPNVKIKDNKSFLYIRTGSNFNQVVDELTSQQILINAESFKWLAEKMNYTDYAMVIKAMGDASRLEIIDMLSCGKMCACDILDHFDFTQPTLSHHMKILCDCGLVNVRKEGKWSHYSLNCETLTQFKEFIEGLTCCGCGSNSEGGCCS